MFQFDSRYASAAALLSWTKVHVYWPLESRFTEVLLDRTTWCVVLGIFALQYCFPARPHQRQFNGPIAQDVVYTILGLGSNLFLTTVFVSLLRTLYDRYLSVLTLSFIFSWPETARLVFVVVISDFVFWFHHYVRHVVPWFWEFHAVHHSQRELNMFTDDRYHFVEYLIQAPFNVIILSMFTVSTLYIVWFQVARKAYTRLYHGNVRTNLGVLRYVFVTPQSHRVHHSADPRHFDKNFGVLFSIWDRLFGTQYVGYDEYPDTGVNGPAFPIATSRANILSTIVAQHLYPIQRVLRSVRQAP